jgi:uncharacterized protein (TIRG00374 family)
LALSPKLLRQFLLWLVIGIAVYGITVVISGVDEMQASLSRIGSFGWAAVIGLSTVNIAIRFLRWQYYLRTLGHAVPVWPSLQYFLAGFAFTSTPAKAGEIVRSVYLKRDGVSYSESLAALFVERLTDLLAVVLLALLVAYQFEDYRWLVALAGIATLAILPLIHSRMLRSLLATANARITQEKLSNGLASIARLLDSSAALLRSGPLYGGMMLSLLAAAAVCMMMYIVLQLLGVDISMPLALGIYATGILAGALSFLPGGIGSAEAVMIALLAVAGADLPTAAAATLVCRIAALWYSIAMGIVIVLLLEYQTHKSPEGS